MTITRVFVLLCVALSFALSGCGGESDEEREREASKGRGEVTCTGSAVADPGLPAAFPQVEGVTYSEARDDGPTHVVNGYADVELKDLYESYKRGFEDAQYDILFDEIEEDDAEISYASADEQSDGIVALREACDDERVSIHITVRPK